MYQYNNPQNNGNASPLPSARMPTRPRFNTGEEYSMQQTSYSSSTTVTPGYNSATENALGYYESSIPGSNNMQQPLLGSPNGSAMSSSVGTGGGGGGGGGGGTRFGSPPSNMIGGGPGDFGIAPRRQQRRYKTGIVLKGGYRKQRAIY